MVSSLLVTLHDLILTVALALGGYLLGATPFALVVARRMYGVDIRRRGTSNVGAGNVYRELGAKAGGLVMACDVGKGLLPALAAVLLLPAWPAALVAFMPMGTKTIAPWWLRVTPTGTFLSPDGKTNDDRWFKIRIMPYRTQDNVIDGVVITFIDITETKRLETQLRSLGS